VVVRWVGWVGGWGGWVGGVGGWVGWLVGFGGHIRHSLEFLAEEPINEWEGRGTYPGDMFWATVGKNFQVFSGRDGRPGTNS